MSNWSNNNRACTNLWVMLYRMNQLKTNFADSESLKMNDLTFFNGLNSAELRKNEALMIADQLDNIFRMGLAAVYETGIDRSGAMGNMVTFLTDGDKTLSEMASEVDTLYKFWGESTVA